MDAASSSKRSARRQAAGRGLGTIVSIALAAATLAAQPVLQVVTSAPGPSLLRNDGFELAQSGQFPSWSAAPNGYRVALGEGRTNSTALLVEATNTAGWWGASQTLTLNRTQPVPITVRGWSRAQEISGSSDSGYALYVDIVYTDGTPLWGSIGAFRTGTHDWELQEFVIHPEKPVRSLSLYCLVRGHTGKAWFDDIHVAELEAGAGTFLYQGSTMRLPDHPSPPAAATVTHRTEDGLEIGWADQTIASVVTGGRDVTGPVRGGLLARDVAANSDLLPFQAGACPELGLRLESTVTPHPNHLSLSGRVTDTTGRDRAIMLVFAVPVDATGWQWHDDIRRFRTIGGTREYSQTATTAAGTTGSLSVYPIAAINDDRTGLALGLDLGQPALYRLAYHAGANHLLLAWDLGLTPATERFPSAADFKVVLYRCDPRWAFRSAFAKFMALFPDYFVVRSRDQGIWMPFTDVSKVQGWADFGFRYHEGNNNVGFDDQHGILSFRYSEPMTWWMPMGTEVPRTIPEALKARDAYATGPSGYHQRMARVTTTAGMTDREQQPVLLFRNEPWNNGAVWSLNPNPDLPDSPNAATALWNPQTREQLYGPGVTATLDGEYLDSLEGYVTPDLNFRREHFRYATTPLTFAPLSREPALFKGLAIYEFTRWISTDVHALGRLMFANSVPYRFPYLCPWLDVMGTETQWLPDGQYQPATHAQLALWRTLSGSKPYLLLMNTDQNRFGPYVERYFQRCLLYGIYPSMFSLNASDNPYWENPAWYNRDRPLFRKYLPILRRVAQAGWCPVTGATSDNPSILIERFGPTDGGERYYTLYNDTAQPQTGAVQEDVASDPAGLKVTELLSGQNVEGTPKGWPVTLSPSGAAVLYVAPRARVSATEVTPTGQVRLTVTGPPGKTHVLESSPDLAAWIPIATNQPLAATFAVEVAWAEGADERFYRFRW